MTGRHYILRASGGKTHVEPQPHCVIVGEKLILNLHQGDALKEKRLDLKRNLDVSIP